MNTPKSKIKIDYFWVKFSVVMVTIIVCLVAIFQINARFLDSAEEVNKLRNEIVIAKVRDQEQVLKSELEKYGPQYEKLKSSFLGLGQILDIFIQLDSLKSAGIINSFEFTTDAPVKDRLGIEGYPITFEITGNQALVNQAFQSVSELPFLIRPIVLNIERVDGDIFNADFGGFIYIDEEHAKN
jgi:hypothetical protein